MPLFYMDVRDGDHFVRDESGTDLISLDAARVEALKTVLRIARKAFPQGDCGSIAVEVRDQGGRAAFTANLSLSVALAT